MPGADAGAVTGSEPSVRFVALGGLGEVGMNCAVLECNDTLLVIDCGVNFPDVDVFGVNVILPDFRWLDDNAERIAGVVITHGHMDHIGALPWLLALVDVPVYAPRFAMGLIRHQLRDHDFDDEEGLFVAEDGVPIELGPFTVEYVRSTHSIPDTYALVIDTPVGRLVHTGDFKIDLTPVDEPPFDLARFSRIGDSGVRALFSDSTNILRDGSTGSEAGVRARLLEVVPTLPGRVIMTQFSTNLFRVSAAADAAKATGRRLMLLGRSLQRNVAIARELGLLDLPDHLIVDLDEFERVPAHQLMVLCTGSQGEPRAALSRIARGEFKPFRLSPGDAVIFSARTIPGNERVIAALEDDLVRSGARIIRDRGLHVSGHACRDEQATMLRLVRPKSLVPVHGDHRFLAAHADLGRTHGVETAHVLDNGDVLELTATDARVVERRELEPAIADNAVFGTLFGETMKYRKRLGRRGVVIVWLVVDGDDGSILDGPEVLNRGAFDDHGGAIIAEARGELVAAIERLGGRDRMNPDALDRTIRETIRRFVRDEAGTRPVIEALVRIDDGA